MCVQGKGAPDAVPPNVSVGKPDKVGLVQSLLHRQPAASQRGALWQYHPTSYLFATVSLYTMRTSRKAGSYRELCQHIRMWLYGLGSMTKPYGECRMTKLYNNACMLASTRFGSTP